MLPISGMASKSANAPYYLLRGGYLYSSSLYAAGLIGYYWSSTPNRYGSSSAYFLYFGSGFVRAINTNYRYYGLSVRSVAAG